MPRKDAEAAREYDSQYYRAHRERILKRKKQRYAENPEPKLRYMRETYYPAHREDRREYMAQYYETYREELLASMRAWRTETQYYENNREKILKQQKEQRKLDAQGLLPRPRRVKIHENGRFNVNPLPPRRGRPRKNKK